MQSPPLPPVDVDADRLPNAASGGTDVAPALAVQESLIEYPSEFPIKVMGVKSDGFEQAVNAVALQFDPFFNASSNVLRDSSGGKYLGITITVTATSRAQLDDLYRALSSHPMVKVVL